MDSPAAGQMLPTSTTPPTASGLQGFPPELIAQIGIHLHPHDVVLLRSACTAFRLNPFTAGFEFAKHNLAVQRSRRRLAFYRRLRFDKLGLDYLAAFIFLEGFCHENGSLQTLCPEFRLFTSSRLRPFPLPDNTTLADALMKAVRAKRRIPNICESCAIAWLASTDFVGHLRDLLAEWRDDKLDAGSLQLGFQQALKYGSCGMARLFLEEEPLHATSSLSPVDALHLAVERGYADVVEFLLREWHPKPRFLPNIPYGCLTTAARNGHAPVVRLLLDAAAATGPNDDTHAGGVRGSIESSLREATKNGHLTVVTMLLDTLANDPTAPPPVELPATLLKLAGENGHTDLLRLLVARFPLTRKDQTVALNQALSRGHVDASAFLLRRLPHLPGLPHLRATRLGYFASIGRLDVVHFVLDYRLARRKDTLHALRRAAVAGRVEVLQVLLRKTRHRASLDRNWLLLAACKHGHLDTVRFLLDQATVRRAGHLDAAFAGAAECGQVRVLDELLERRLVDPDVGGCGEEAAVRCVRHGAGPAVLRRVLDAMNTNRIKAVRAALELACSMAAVDVALMVLERYDDGVELGGALVEAAKTGQSGIVHSIFGKTAAARISVEELCRAYGEAAAKNHPVTARIVWDYIKAREAAAAAATATPPAVAAPASEPDAVAPAAAPFFPPTLPASAAAAAPPASPASLRSFTFAGRGPRHAHAAASGARGDAGAGRASAAGSLRQQRRGSSASGRSGKSSVGTGARSGGVGEAGAKVGVGARVREVWVGLVERVVRPFRGG
ncbi:hypothetical protein HDU96_007801 [Phlyctochytrium bullatum]|nr:hypothetical protein HDU96_007801 [Phlyctochytrium bullatum]